MSAPAATSAYFPTVRSVLRVVLVVVAVVVTLALMYLLRQPLTWIFIAAFIAVALSGPINFLERRMRRGFAVAIVYLCLILAPFALIGLLIPPIVTQANNLVQNLPEYAQDFTEFVEGNERLRGEVTKAADWRGHFERNRKQILIGAAVAGFVVGGGIAAVTGMLTGRRKSRDFH